MRIAVLGSGGIGGYYGALLADGGHDVVFVARGAHLEAMRQRGLTIRTPGGEVTRPVTAVADTRGVEPVDLVLSLHQPSTAEQPATPAPAAALA